MKQATVSRRQFTRLLGLVGSATLAACGGGSSEATQPAQQAQAASSGDSATPVTLEISSLGDDSRFDQEMLEAPAGSKITLVLKNASSPEANKQFNWVLTQPGKQLLVVNDGLGEGEANGFVKLNDPNVIAATPLVRSGESASVAFDAPPPGNYPYICTYPGFYTRMRGVLTIK